MPIVLTARDVRLDYRAGSKAKCLSWWARREFLRMGFGADTWRKIIVTCRCVAAFGNGNDSIPRHVASWKG